MAEARWPLVESRRARPRGTACGCRLSVEGRRMTLLTAQTDVFSASQASERCVVLFIARSQPRTPGIFEARHLASIRKTLGALQAEDWRLSLRAMIEPLSQSEPMAFDTGYAHDIDV